MCERPLNARMTREGDRVRTYWECPVCDQDGEGVIRIGRPSRSAPARDSVDMRLGSRHCAAAATLERPLDLSPDTLSPRDLAW
jgi:hypothetical protein